MNSESQHSDFAKFVQQAQFDQTSAAYLFGPQCQWVVELKGYLKDADDPGRDEFLKAVEQFGQSSDRLQVFGGVEGMPDQQADHLIQGMVATTKLLLSAADRAKSIRQVVASFNAAWPVEPPQEFFPPPETNHEFTAAVGRGAVGLGYWIAWDLFHELGKRVAEGEWRQASTPVLFDDDADGTAARLCVELRQHEATSAGLLYPDPLRLGLWPLSHKIRKPGSANELVVDPHSFHLALQRVWRMSGLPKLGWRGRWWLEPVNDRESLPLRRLHGRSLEAAVCAAIWSAFRGIPNEGNGDQGAIFELDRRAAITALLDEAHAAPGRPYSEIRLLPVTGIEAKIRAAIRAGVDWLVVAPAQTAEHGGSLEELFGHPRRIFRAATIGEALNRLLAMNRAMDDYRNWSRAQWDQKFQTPPEDQADDPAADDPDGTSLPIETAD